MTSAHWRLASANLCPLVMWNRRVCAVGTSTSVLPLSRNFPCFSKNLRNFEREFFKEVQKFKKFQGNLKNEKEIIQKFREFKEIWVKCKETNQIQGKSLFLRLARVFHFIWARGGGGVTRRQNVRATHGTHPRPNTSEIDPKWSIKAHQICASHL